MNNKNIGRWFYHGREVFSNDGGKTFIINSRGDYVQPGINRSLKRADRVVKDAYKSEGEWHFIGSDKKVQRFTNSSQQKKQTISQNSPSISKSKKSNFIPKESNQNSNGTASPTVTVTAPRIKKQTTSQKSSQNSRVNSTQKPKVNTQTSQKKETPKIQVTAQKPNAGETVKNNITPKLHYTRNYKQRVSELGLNDRDAVKAIQRQLGVYDDGIWGDNTERAYQALRGNMNSENYNNTVFDTNADLTNAPTVAKVPNTLNFLNPGVFQNIINRPLSQLAFAKNGAKLVSKNPIKRFKSFKKC